MANPLNPPYQGDFGNFAKVGVIGKCLVISLIHHICPSLCSHDGYFIAPWGKTAWTPFTVLTI